MNNITLAIETSCDETSVAVVKNGREVLSNVILSQIKTHQKFGGVVPEIASREHLEAINYVIKQGLYEANLDFDQIDTIAVTKGPGLIGALLVGISAAKGMSMALKKPLVGVNHMQGHICANYLAHKDLEPPFISLVVSGGHTYLVDVLDYNNYEVIGRTKDDAAGESFDKVSRALGLGYPGGPQIQKAAELGNPEAINFPRVMLEKDSYDFSFSGLKTAVLNYLNTEKMASREINPNDVAASFQQAVLDVLVEKSIRLVQEKSRDKLVLSGGVAANKPLRDLLESKCKEISVEMYYPPLDLCTDNAAMIGSAGYFTYINNGAETLDMDVFPNLGL